MRYIKFANLCINDYIFLSQLDRLNTEGGAGLYLGTLHANHSVLYSSATDTVELMVDNVDYCIKPQSRPPSSMLLSQTLPQDLFWQICTGFTRSFVTKVNLSTLYFISVAAEPRQFLPSGETMVFNNLLMFD